MTRASGWFLYARVGEIGDCRGARIAAPARRLCDRGELDRRRGAEYHLWDSRSPANRLFPGDDRGDPRANRILHDYAVAIIRDRPLAYIQMVSADFLRYFSPAVASRGDSDLAITLPRRGRTGTPWINERVRAAHFPTYVPPPSGVRSPLLGTYQQWVHVPRWALGPLVLATALVLMLALLSRLRTRLPHRREAFLLVGMAVAMLLGSVATSEFVLRYLVPTVPLLLCGGALAACDLAGLSAPRRRICRDEGESSDRVTRLGDTEPGKRRPAVVVLHPRPLHPGERGAPRAAGAEALCYHPVPDLPTAVVRDVVGALRCAAYIMGRRPAAVVTTSPPGRVLHAAVRAGARATGALVIEEAGATAPVGTPDATADLVDAAPPAWTVEPARRLGQRPRVVVLGSYGPGEPTAAIMEAAHLLPSVDMWITGEPRKCPSWITDRTPSNVTCIGSPCGSDRPRVIAAADVVLTLSTDRGAIMRPAFEATYAGRPLVVSDLPGLRRVLPHAIHVSNDGASIVAAVRSALERHASLVAAAPAARELQSSRWRRRVAALRGRLEGMAHEEPPARTGRFGAPQSPPPQPVSGER